MELKGRLKLIADKTPKCKTVCDIGTDHAYIPIYLIKKNICRYAVASDVKVGPINAARENIKIHGLSDRIEVRLGNGLETIGENEVDVIIIAGMGGILMKDILSQGLDKARNAGFMVLQPMNALEDLRKWLYLNGFEILDEELVNEGEKIYNVIVTKWTGVTETVDELCYYIGKKLIEKSDPLLLKYLSKKLAQVEEVIEGIERMNNTDYGLKEKYNGLREGFKGILNGIKNK